METTIIIGPDGKRHKVTFVGLVLSDEQKRRVIANEKARLYGEPPPYPPLPPPSEPHRVMPLGTANLKE